MLGVTILASLSESAGEISVEAREVQFTENGEYYYLHMFCCKALSLAQIT